MRFAKEAIMQGRLNQEASAETPGTFATIDSATQNKPDGRDMSVQHTRMAGTVGARAVAMMTNKEEMARTNDWMEKFGRSNQGVEWNQAKMGGMAPPAPAAANAGGQEAAPPPSDDVNLDT